MTVGFPEAEWPIDEILVRNLLSDQHPDLADLPLIVQAQGWDNVTVRCGNDLVVRLPRRQLAAPLAVNEQRWLPNLAPTLPVPVPVPLRVGRPGHGYPWSWSVCPWIPGHPLGEVGNGVGVGVGNGVGVDELTLGRELAGFLTALHRPAPPNAPMNPFRGVPLKTCDERVRERLGRLGQSPRLADPDSGPVVEIERLLDLWDELIEVPGWGGPPLWLHGDLHPLNILVHPPAGVAPPGVLAGVIDFGDLGRGDPATDLSVAWSLLGPDAREVFAAGVRVDGAEVDGNTWRRARGWALALGVMHCFFSANSAVFERVGRRALGAVLDDQVLPGGPRSVP